MPGSSLLKMNNGGTVEGSGWVHFLCQLKDQKTVEKSQTLQTRSAAEERSLLEWTYTHIEKKTFSQSRRVEGSLRKPKITQSLLRGVGFLKSWRVFLPLFKVGPFEERWDAWLAHSCYITCSEPVLNLLSQSVSSRPPIRDKSLQGLCLKLSESVSSWESEEETCHPGNVPPLLPNHGPLPICLPPWESV